MDTNSHDRIKRFQRPALPDLYFPPAPLPSLASATRAASSISTATPPKIPASCLPSPATPQSATRSAAAAEVSLSPSPRGRIPSIAHHLRTPSAPTPPLCRSVGLATSTRLFSRVYARCNAFAAAIVDFPHCRVQFRIPRFASDRKTSIWRSSGSNRNRFRANSTASITSRASGRRSRFSRALSSLNV